MSEIPDEFVRAALNCIRQSGGRDDLPFSIARAIRAERLAERERCAQVAESCGNTWSGTRDAMQAVQEAAVDEKCVEIAAAIRGQP